MSGGVSRMDTVTQAGRLARRAHAPLRGVLIVEDDADDEVMILEAMRHAHLSHPVRVARDGPAAIAALLPAQRPADHESPALVLLDLRLPGMPGLAVLERVRADPRTRTLPVVVLSGSPDPQDVSASYLAGANSFVRKPDTLAEFQSRIAHVLQYWLTSNEPPHA